MKKSLASVQCFSQLHCKASLVFLFIYGNKVILYVLWEPFHLDSILVHLLCFSQWPMPSSDRAFIHVPLSTSALDAAETFLLWAAIAAVSSVHMTAIFLYFFCDRRDFKLHVCYETRPLGQKTFPKTWDIYIALRIITKLRKFIVQILTLTEVLE